ncbi:hypothetical protein BESB_054230 [Besnoitia besnoiti]|uniref:Apple domain-containing protein n=1 Tax=Besnoitia besnoiti TaxID=94643 RepID=A0A2A9MK42_BESBE|nr:hypothetical protein BESB_054230 [Besnoitia besnoiti]PFH35772.1 hypothetical protein BESB_054230 [Besnoitia besnoiti]
MVTLRCGSRQAAPASLFTVRGPWRQVHLRILILSAAIFGILQTNLRLHGSNGRNAAAKAEEAPFVVSEPFKTETGLEGSGIASIHQGSASSLDLPNTVGTGDRQPSLWDGVTQDGPCHLDPSENGDSTGTRNSALSDCAAGVEPGLKNGRWLDFSMAPGPYFVGSTVTVEARPLHCISSSAGSDGRELDVTVSLILLDRLPKGRPALPLVTTSSNSAPRAERDLQRRAVFTTYGESIPLTAIPGEPFTVEWLVTVPGSYLIEVTGEGMPPAVLGTLVAVEKGSQILKVIQQPQNGESGEVISPTPMLEVVDGNGETTTVSASTILARLYSPASEIQQGKRLPVLRGKTLTRVSRGIAAFPGLSVQEAGVGYRLSFIDISGRIPVEVFSDVFDIAAGPPAKLLFVEQPPATVSPGQAIRAAVEVQDKHGNRAAGKWDISLAVVEEGHQGDSAIRSHARPAVDNTSHSNPVVFDALTIPDAVLGIYAFMAECETCPSPLAVKSSPVRLTPKTEVWVLTDCGILSARRGDRTPETNLDRHCVIQISLSEGGKPVSLTAPVAVHVDILEGNRAPMARPRISLASDELHFIPGGPTSRSIHVEALEEDGRESAVSRLNESASNSWIRHLLLLHTQSNDQRWTEPAVRWPSGKEVTIITTNGAPDYAPRDGVQRAGDRLRDTESSKASGFLWGTLSSVAQPECAKAILHPRHRLREADHLSARTHEAKATRSTFATPLIVSTGGEPGSQLAPPAGMRLPSDLISMQEDMGQIRWNSTDILVREGTSVELAFQLGARPLAAVYVSLSCPSPFIKHTKDRAEVEPEEWLFGDSLLVNALPRPDFPEAQYTVKCNVSSRSDDPRYVFDAESFANSSQEDAQIFGAVLQLTVYRHQCHDGSFKGFCPCPTGYACDGASTVYKCPAGTESTPHGTSCRILAAGVVNAKNCECEHYSLEWANHSCPVGHYSLSMSSGVCSRCPPNTYSEHVLRDKTCYICPHGFISGEGAAGCVQGVSGNFISAYEKVLRKKLLLGPGSNESVGRTYQCGGDKSGSYSFDGQGHCSYGRRGNMQPAFPFSGRLYDCPPGFAIGSDHQCWEVDRSKYSLGKNALLCQGGVFHRTLMDRCTPCPQGFSCHVEEKYKSWLTRCKPGSASYLGDADCVKCRAGYFCPGYMEPFWQPPLRRFPGWYESGFESSTSPEVKKHRLQMQGYCGMGTYGRLYVDVEGRPGEYYATYNSTCATCPPGTFCYDVGIVNFQAYKCPPGHYCLGGDSIPVPCPPGSYYPFRGAMSSNACMTCPDGFDCEKLSQKVEPELCPPGFICPFGRKKIACPDGTTNPLPGQSALEQCERCPAGYYCANKAGAPKPCPAGTYNPFEGAQSSADCLPCPGGFQCSSPGAVYYLGRCPPGAYCNEASTAPDLCPEGTWRPGYLGTSLMHCHACPAGARCKQGTTAATIEKCPRGSFCASGLVVTCPPGTFAENSSLQGPPDCAPCEPGNYCPTPDTKTPCPAGHYCPAGQAKPIPCPQGTYSGASGVKNRQGCLPCTTGHSCPAGTIVPQTCPAGTYMKVESDNSVSIKLEVCAPCEAGNACKDGFPIACGKGYYSGPGQTECDECPEEPYPQFLTDGIDGATIAQKDRCQHGKCPARPAHHGAAQRPSGQLALGRLTKPGLQKSEDCEKCPAGKYCGSLGASQATGDCKAGFFCEGGAATAAPQGSLCPMNAFCPGGTQSPGSCDDGFYIPWRGAEAKSSCVQCPAGKYCESVPDGPTAVKPCNPGYYCEGGAARPNQHAAPQGSYAPAGSTQALKCPRGTFSDTEAQAECKPCAEGKLCSALGSRNETECPQGSYCPAAAESDVYCPRGTYGERDGLPDAWSCTPCGVGKYCLDTGLKNDGPSCAAGFHCAGGSRSIAPLSTEQGGGICRKGYFCKAGTAQPQECPRGTYNPNVGASSDADCLDCPAGQYCSDSGLETPTGACLKGFFCPAKSEAPDSVGNSCTAGQYCPSGSERAKACPGGTFQDSETAAACSTCPAGYACPAGSAAGAVTGQLCDKGHYCPEGSSSKTQYPCPPGFYNPTQGARSLEDCKLCPPGKFCDKFGLSEPTGDCSAGLYCAGGATSAQGQYEAETAHDGSDRYNRSCWEVDKEAIATDQSVVIDGVEHASECMERCQNDNVCKYFSWSPSRICTIISGSFELGNCAGCQAGPKSCSTACFYDSYDFIGTVVATYKQSRSPHYCQARCATNILCSVFVYDGVNQICYLKSHDALSYRVQAGQPGYVAGPHRYCGFGGTLSSICRFPAGLPGTARRICDGDERGYGTLLEAGRKCEITAGCRGIQYFKTPDLYYIRCGDFSEQLTDDDATWFPMVCGEMGLCKKGTYCPRGSARPVLCSTGKYCADEGLQTETGECREGFWCPGGSASETPSDSPCPAGHYCESGTRRPAPCPEGTFRAERGARNQDDCSACTPGFYCKGTGLTAPSGPCNRGYSCPSKSTTPTAAICTKGHYCPAGAAEPIPCPQGQHQPDLGQSECVACPAGKACGAATEPDECPAGYFCPAGTLFPHQYPCPAGSYSDAKGNILATECLPCPEGKVCDEPGTPSATTLCPPGYFCPEGTDSPHSNECEVGQYCQEGASEPQMCPAGYFCGAARLHEPSGGCYAGFLCISGAASPSPFDETVDGACAEPIEGGECPAGNFCVPASTIDDVIKPEGGHPSPLTAPGHAITNPHKHNDIYVIDGGDIKRIERRSGQVTVLASTRSLGVASDRNLSGQPERLALDYAGATLYISYPGEAKIVSYDLADSTTKEFSGQLTRPIGISIDNTSTFLYIADAGAHKIVRLNLASGTVSDWLGSGTPGDVCGVGVGLLEVQLNEPHDVTTDDDGIVYVADTGNIRVQKSLFVADGTARSVWQIRLPSAEASVAAGNGAADTRGADGTLPADQFPLGPLKSLGRGTEVDQQVFDVLISSQTAGGLRRLALSNSMRSLDALAEPCPPGTFLPYKGGRGISECLPCPAGMYCQAAGQVVPSGRCEQAHFCPAGSTSPTEQQCPAKHFCGRDDEVRNIAANADATTTRRRDWVEPNRPTYAVDGVSGPEKGWLSKNTPGSPHELEIEFDTYYFINKYKIYSGDAAGLNVATTFSIRAWNPQASQWLQASIPVKNNFEGEVEGDIMDVYTNRIHVEFNQDQVFVAEIMLFGTELPGVLNPVRCPPGTYQDEAGQAECKACSPGYQCRGGQAAMEECKAGFYCPGGVSAEDAFPCPLGTVGSQPGLSFISECSPCPPGKYCGERGLTDATDKCAPGHICWEGSWLKAPFAGDVNPDLPQASPLLVNGPCPAGYYCPEGTPSPIPCPKASHSAFEGAKDHTECTPCAPGYACPSKGEIVPCGAGYYCTAGADTPWPADPFHGGACGAGYFCPGGAYRQTPCAPGSFSSGGQTDCTPCTAGYYCESSQTALVDKPCAAGSFCADGASFQRPCPIGTFSSDTGASACTVCTPRYYCAEAKLSAPSGLCEEGYVCAANAVGSRPSNQIFSAADDRGFGACPTGHYCVQGTGAPAPCQRGTYQDSPFASSCKPCEPGKFCGQTGLSAPSGGCAPGYYCLESATVPNPTDGVTGNACPAGWHCPEGSFAPKACPHGTYTDRVGEGECKPCPAGYACYGNSPEPQSCPQGQMCPAGSFVGVHCPPGSYLNTESRWRKGNTNDHARSQCVPCPPGKYCRAGLIAGDCASGYLCALGNAFPHPNALEGRLDAYVPEDALASGNYQIINGDNWGSSDLLYGGIPCPAGHFCRSGVTTPEPCPKGSSRVDPGGRYSVDCSQCPAGFYCPEALKPAPCPKGHYCPASSRYPIPCPERHFNPSEHESESGACRLCLPGYYCGEGQGALTSSNVCPAGHYCPPGTATPYPCPAGTYAPSRGSKEATHCVPCPAAHYCSQGAAQPTRMCPSGKYCPPGTALPLPCAVGSFCQEGSSKPVKCPASHYCPGVTGTAMECLPGTYCPVGAQFPESCPAGTFANIVSAQRYTVEGGCTLCPKGTFRETAGSNVCKPCGAGHMCYEGCTAMFPRDAMTEKREICPPGHFCPLGSFQAIPCPSGTYNPSPGKTAVSDCRPCSDGSFGVLPGQTQCVFCGGSTSTSPAGSVCQCVGRNRIFQPSTRACVCKSGHVYKENGANLSDQDGKGDCQEEAYEGCNAGTVRGPDSLCTPPDVLCHKQCGLQNGSYDSAYQRCFCTGSNRDEEVCDEECRQRVGTLSIRGEDIVFTDGRAIETSVFQIAALEESQVMAGSPSCPPENESDCTVVVQEVSEEGIRGLFGPPRDLEAIFNQRLNGDSYADARGRRTVSSSARTNKRTFTFKSATVETPYVVAQSGQYVSHTPGVMSPVQCITAGTTVVWMVRPGEGRIASARYPVYLKNVGLNTVGDFDDGSFTKLKLDLLSGVKWVLFAHTFGTPGVYVFGSHNSTILQSLIKVVDGVNERCPPGSEHPNPQTRATLRALGIGAEIIGHLPPRWHHIVIASVLMAVIALGTIILAFVFRRYFWVFPATTTTSRRTTHSLLHYVRDLLLCRLERGGKESGNSVAEDFDPRVFQASYLELLHVQNCVADGVAALRKDNAARDEMLQDKELAFRYKLSIFLRRIQDHTEELIGSREARGHRLGMATALLLLRKDCLVECVRAARPPMANAEATAGTSQQIQTELSLSPETEKCIAKVQAVPSASIAAELKAAVRELVASLAQDRSEEELSSVVARFQQRMQAAPGIEEDYAGALAALTTDKLTQFANRVRLETELQELEDAISSARHASREAKEALIVEAELALLREADKQNGKRIECAEKAFASVMDAHNAFAAILWSDRNHAQLQAACAEFSARVIAVINDVGKRFDAGCAELRNTLSSEAATLATQLESICSEDERQMQDLQDQREAKAEAIFQSTCREERNSIGKIFETFKERWSLRADLTFEALLCTSLSTRSEDAFPSLALCATPEDAVDIEASFDADKQQITKELHSSCSRHGKEVLAAAESALQQRSQILHRRQRLEHLLHETAWRSARRKQVCLRQLDRQQAGITMEEILICFSSLVRAFDNYRTDLCGALAAFAQKTKLLGALFDIKERQFERGRTIADLSRALAHAEAALRKSGLEAATSLFRRVRAKVTESRSVIAKQLAKENLEDVYKAQDAQRQLRLYVYKLAVEEFQAQTNFLATLTSLLFKAEEKQAHALSDVQMNFQKFVALGEDRRWLCSQINELRKKGGAQEWKVNALLEEYSKTRDVAESLLSEQRQQRLRDVEERSHRLHESRISRLLRLAEARKRLVNDIQGMNTQLDKDMAAWSDTFDTVEEDLFDLHLKFLGSSFQLSLARPSLHSGDSISFGAQAFQAASPVDAEAKIMSGNEELTRVRERLLSQMTGIKEELLMRTEEEQQGDSNSPRGVPCGDATENEKLEMLERFDNSCQRANIVFEDERQQARLAMESRIAARAARRKNGSSAASDTGCKAGRHDLLAEWNAEKRKLVERRQAMERRQHQELDELAALQLQEKLAVVLLERDVKLAELEASHRIAELRESSPEETDAKTDARMSSLEKVKELIETELRAHLEQVQLQEQRMDLERLKHEHADQLRDLLYSLDENVPLTNVADILDCNAKVNACLKEMEMEHMKDMRRKLEEVRNEIVHSPRNNSAEETSQNISRLRDEQRRNEWREKIANKRTQAWTRRSQILAGGARTDALLISLRQKMDTLLAALEEDRRCQLESVAEKLKQRQITRMAKFGDSLGHRKENRKKRLTARVARIKDTAAKRIMWNQQKRKGTCRAQLSPLAQRVVDEELLAESLRQYKEESTVQFRGNFMRLLVQLELGLRNVVVPQLLSGMHAVGRGTVARGGPPFDSLLTGPRNISVSAAGVRESRAMLNHESIVSSRSNAGHTGGRQDSEAESQTTPTSYSSSGSSSSRSSSNSGTNSSRRSSDIGPSSSSSSDSGSRSSRSNNDSGTSSSHSSSGSGPRSSSSSDSQASSRGRRSGSRARRIGGDGPSASDVNASSRSDTGTSSSDDSG